MSNHFTDEPTLRLCASQEVGVHWYTRGGRYVSGLAVSTSPVQRRIRQFEALRDPGLAFRLGRRLAMARASSQLGFLLRASRGKDRTRLGIDVAVRGLRFTSPTRNQQLTGDFRPK